MPVCTRAAVIDWLPEDAGSYGKVAMLGRKKSGSAWRPSLRVGVVVAMVVWAGLAGAQEVSENAAAVPSGLNPRVDQFLDAVGRGQVQAAYDTLLKGSALAQQTESLASLVARTAELNDRYGRFVEAEALPTRLVGRDVAVVKYLYKCEQYPVVWTLVFYRPYRGNETAARDDDWRVIAVRFDTEIESLARELDGE